MRRFCKFCKKQNDSNRDYCDLKCRLLKDIMIMKNGCWEWQGLIDSKGYGFFTLRICNSNKRKVHLVHRRSFEVFKGSIPKDKDVCHSCDNRKCIKPSHLWIGTNEENMSDCRRKGRWSFGFSEGSKCHSAKLNEDKVLEIRKKHTNGISQIELSKQYGVNDRSISGIVNRKTWKHI